MSTPSSPPRKIPRYLKKVQVSKDVNLENIALLTRGFSGAGLFEVVNAAAIRAATLKKPEIDLVDIEWSVDKQLLGAERTTAAVPHGSERKTALHEGGHALVALYTTGARPIHKVTVVPRGNALGLVAQVPGDVYTSPTKQDLLARIDVCMGGRVAEEIMFGDEHVSVGASDDFRQASLLAREFVVKFGMSELGHVYDDGQPFGGRHRDAVDAQVKLLVADAYARTKRLLQERQRELVTLADALQKYKTLSGTEVREVLDGKEPNRQLSVAQPFREFEPVQDA